MSDRADRLVAELVQSLAVPGLRKASVRPQSSIYATWSHDRLKAEAMLLQRHSGESKRACSRLFGVPWETCRDWLDPGQPKKHPPADFVEWLAHRVAARSLVRVA